MRCTVVKMRNAGVAVPQYALKEQIDWRGDLVIMDQRDDGVRGYIKTARLLDQSYSAKRVEVLYEVHIPWMNEDRFVLQGFERALNAGKAIENAQSWLCRIEPDEAVE